MSSPGTVVTRCNNCGNTQGFQYTVFGTEGIAACPGCGLTLNESDLQMQDELTKMFTQSMNLEQRPESAPVSRHSITQHYHHSHHLLAAEAMTSKPSGEITDSEAIEILAEHGIEAIHLSFSQAALFKKADPSQRDRLIELWRISPPKPSDWQGSGGPKETSIQMEEDLARQRYTDTETSTVAEPYITAGYDAPKSTYSPYGSSIGAVKPQIHGAEWWRDFMGDQPMELQYGMLEYMSYQPPARPVTAGDDSEMH